MAQTPVLDIFIGYDRQEVVAYHVLAQSLLEQSSRPVRLTAINLGNLGFLNRKPHRVKTHATGWRHHQPEPGVHYWRTPAGYWFRVDHRGSHALGRGEGLPWTGPTQPTAHSAADLCWPLQRHSAGESVLLDIIAG